MIIRQDNKIGKKDYIYKINTVDNIETVENYR